MASDGVVGQKEGKRYEFKRLGYSLVLEISTDGLVCESFYEPSPNGAPLSLEELMNYLAQAKVKEGISEGAVEELLVAATAQTVVTGHPLAHGIPMVPGEDGRISLSAAGLTEDHGEDPGEEEDGGVVDFRVVQHFHNVNSGDLVGTVLPPGEGIPGMTVHGTRIEPRAGEPLKLQLGQNVGLGPDGVSLYAEADGRVFCSGAEISVDDVYTIKGDLDFKVGNVEFNGFLDVTGDVLDGFSVNATKGIKVRGNVGACCLESGGGISFCGMSGMGRGKVTAGGDVVANYINEVTVEAGGDIVVEAEARNCIIKALGSIRVNRGGLSGGEYIACAGMEVATAGTVTSLRTVLVAGINYRDQEEINLLFNELKRVIADFNGGKGGMDARSFAEKRNAITNRIQEVRSREYDRRNPKINVKKKLYDGVTLTLGGICEEVKEERDGPVSIIENTIDGGLRYIGLTDLSVKAQDIERAYVQQNELALRKTKEVA